MIAFDEAQWDRLKAKDVASFVASVCDQFLADRPDMVITPGRDIVHKRMHSARDFTDRADFTSSPHVVQFMYLSADYPGFYDDKLVAAYISKPGATPEQRFEDLLAVLRHELSVAQGSVDVQNSRS